MTRAFARKQESAKSGSFPAEQGAYSGHQPMVEENRSLDLSPGAFIWDIVFNNRENSHIRS